TVLEKDGWNVSRDASAEDAFAMLGQESWSIVFCDVMLGGADGFAVLRRFKEELPDTKVVLMTGQGDASGALDATAFGAYDYLLKPFGPDELQWVPAELLGSEGVGHVRGTFTGADRDRRGLWEEANGVTVFLDEITETSLPFQVKLLRVLQEGEIRRVGSNQTQRVNVRIIAASNRDVEAEVRAGRFRNDLFYRLNAVSIHLPPLRERREDIPPL